MTISDLYHQLHIPPNLQRHMLEVTAVGEYVCEHWTGEPLDAQLVRDTLLMHDLGNIVKFKRPFLGELEEEAENWEKIQNFYVEKFGVKATTVTVAILAELGARQEIAALLLDMSPEETGAIALEHEETRICSFADMSVTQRGIECFEARMLDLGERYPTERVAAAMAQERKNAAFVQEHVGATVMTLPREQLEQRMSSLTQTEFELTVPAYFAVISE